VGKSYFVSGFRDGDPRGGKDMWVDLESEMREGSNDRHPGMDSIATEQRPVIDPRTGQQAINPLTGKPRFRPVKPDSALGFASEDFHYAGDRIVTLNEEVEVKGGKPTGRILHHFQRIDDQGRSLGTYEQAWEKEREGRMRSAGKARKYYSF
jgi:hypothetical protein